VFKKAFFFSEVVNIHFSFANFDRGLSRNNWYKALHMVKRGKKSFFSVNKSHNWFYQVKEKDLLPTRREWFQGYLDKGMDVTSNETPDLFWDDVEVLRWFNQYGTKRLFLLDIWRGIDWEEKRKIALERGIPGVPSSPIEQPSRAIVFFNGLGTYKFSLLELLRKIRTAVLKKILP